MTITSTSPREIKNGNGTATVFSFTFVVNQASDLVVTLVDANDNETVLTEGTGTTNYSVSVSSYPGTGSVTYPATLGTELAGNEQLIIQRVVDIDQETDLVNQGAWKPEQVENTFDYSRMIDLQQQDELDRAIKSPASTPLGTNYTLPAPESLALFRWNEAATDLEAVQTADLVTTANFSNFKTDTFADGVDYTAGTTTQITLDTAPGTIANTQVYFDGVYQEKADYALAGTVITFDTAIPIGVSTVEVVYGKAADVLAGSTRETQLGDGSKTVFTLSNGYEPGNGTLHVYINGVRQEVSYGYTETDANTVTFDSAPANNDLVLFIVNAFVSQTTADASNVTYTPSGTGAVATNVQAKLSESVSVKDFGAVGDGVTDDTAAIQAALDSASPEVKVSDGTYLTTSTLTASTAGQKILLSPGATINLSTSTASHIALHSAASRVSIEGGAFTTTLRTLLFLVDLSGASCSIHNSKLYYATKSTIAPISGTDIPYNRGGIAVRADNCVIKGCEIYNQEGAAAVVYEDKCRILDNHLHDNVLGMHLNDGFTALTSLYTLVRGNTIIDNDVNAAQGADGILASGKFAVTFTNNHVENSGEHGTYIYGDGSIISNNTVVGNASMGIKIRDCSDVTVSNNFCGGNNTSAISGSSEIYFQLNNSGLTNVSILGNSINGTSGEGGVRVVFSDAGASLQKLNVSGNNISVSSGNAIDVAVTSNSTVSNNVTNAAVLVATGQALAPAEQTGLVVSGNHVGGELNCGRAKDSLISSNHITTLDTGSNKTGNRIVGNTITAQSTQINRTFFSEFSNNYIDGSGVTGDLFEQASSAALNSDKLICGNHIIGNGTRIMDDSSSGISGDNNTITGNMISNSADLVSIWGSNHTITGNNNYGGGGIGFVGMNNSWAVSNNPIVTLRGGTTGNVVL